MTCSFLWIVIALVSGIYYHDIMLNIFADPPGRVEVVTMILPELFQPLYDHSIYDSATET